MKAAVVSFAKHVRHSSRVDIESSGFFSSKIRYSSSSTSETLGPDGFHSVEPLGCRRYSRAGARQALRESPEGQPMKMRVFAAVAVAVPLAFGTSRLVAQGNSDHSNVK